MNLMQSVPSFLYIIYVACSDFCATAQSYLEEALYSQILGVPFIILWTVSLGIFCALRLKFVNFRLFFHALKVLTGRYDKKSGKGAISHLQAFFTSVSGTVGLGTIAGVAIAITVGGPGSILWMALIGILGMSVKFSEVVLAFKYRTLSGNKTRSGPFEYMKTGFAEQGYGTFGKMLSIFYAVLLIIAMIFGGIPFQANQTVIMLNNLLSFGHTGIISIILALLVGLVVMGGIRRIASITVMLAPIMTILYVIGCVIIIYSNREHLFAALCTIFNDALQPSSVSGGAMACFVAGVRRSVFANEAGIGTAAIAHSATKDTSAVRAGCSAMLEPCIDTILISCLTGIMIVTLGEYSGSVDASGIMLAGRAFIKIFPLFGYIIFPIIVFSFAFSTIIAYSYYCEVSWRYLWSSERGVYVCRILVLFAIFVSGLSTNVLSIAALGDLLFMFLSIPNAIAIYFLSNVIAKEISIYIRDLKS